MKCEHCSKDCMNRVAVRHKGKILMVGTGCSKHFKKANQKYRFKAIFDIVKERRLKSIFDIIEKSKSQYNIDTSREDFVNNYKEIIMAVFDDENTLSDEKIAKTIMKSDYGFIIADLIANRYNLSDEESENIINQYPEDITEYFEGKQKPEDVYMKLYFKYKGLSLVKK